MKTINLLALIGFVSFTSIGQKKFSDHEISINAFRNPSVGVEYRYHHISIHAGYYPTNFESGVTTSFIRSGVTYWFLPIGEKENPSSFYSSLSYARGLDRDYKNKNAGMLETGFRWMIWKGLNFRLGVTALKAPDLKTKINPTPGLSYSFFFR